MTIELYAQPYDIAAQGFFFDSFEAYEREAATKVNSFGTPVEEYEIQFIDGATIDAQLFDALKTNQASIEAFFRIVDAWDSDQKALVIIAVGDNVCGFDPETDDPHDLDIDLYEVETLRELAEVFVDEGLFGDIPEHLRNYIDYDAIARDLALDYTPISIAGRGVICRAA